MTSEYKSFFAISSVPQSYTAEYVRRDIETVERHHRIQMETIRTIREATSI
jgi:hypothetical protein